MSDLIRDIPRLWTACRSFADAIRETDGEWTTLVEQRMNKMEHVLAGFGVDLMTETDEEVIRVRDVWRCDPVDIVAAYCDLAVGRIPVFDRWRAFFEEDYVRWGGSTSPWPRLYLLAALGLDIDPAHAVVHDFPREWEQMLEVWDRDRIGDLFERLQTQVADLPGVMLAVHADLRGYHDRHAAVSCPTEAEARMLLGTRDLAAADALVAIPFAPMSSGPGGGRFIVVDFETRTVFTPADLGRCRGVG